jgi:hypothetical protein
MGDEIGRRIARASGVPDLVEVLADRLRPTDLRSLLLAVFRRRAARATPADVLRRYRTDRFVRPAAADPRALAGLERLVVAAVPDGWEMVELSPVAPLGTAAAVADVSPDWAVATIRGNEVVSDATNVLALECAVRRERDRTTSPTTLVAIHRVLRPQASDDPARLAHFRLLAICTAGRDEGSFAFETRHVGEQLAFHLGLLETLGAAAPQVRLTALDDRRSESLEAIAASLTERFPRASFALDPTRRTTYYTTACFAIDAGGRNLVDGGLTGWTQRLLADRKERLVISGAGLERLLEAQAPS